MNELLVDRLKNARAESGLKQQEVAEKLGIKANTISNWEQGRTEPDIDTFVKLCNIYQIDCSSLLSDVYAFKRIGSDISLSEYDHIKKYRSLDDMGKSHIDYELNREVKRVEKMQSLESAQSAVIEFHGNGDDTNRLLEYFRSASAGTGVFILGNEASEQIAIPNTPENQYADFAIGVDGNSMEPDYHDGDIVLVSQKLEMNHGDIGIFIINNRAYIKEYGETELISRNPAAKNVTISEYDNIVCMGKVIGKLPND
ncbi:MAG: helix-turn-helix domain-containing protein [Lachnospiraceae bacterium]|nr:helix-turn-helix domain-containing protein [Lachnospiraceae bacterium]